MAILFFCISPVKRLVVSRFKARKLQSGVFTHKN